ncbi:hypothetical protein I4U23_004521 [Adineta vaga]|nr:hypothetical protein I4U23_004521 [Adineta vaga]
METISQGQIDIDNNEFISTNLLTKKQIESEVNATIDSFKNSVSMQIISFLKYINTTNLANYLISALNTNALFKTEFRHNLIRITAKEICYYFYSMGFEDYVMCGDSNPTSESIFLSSLNDETFSNRGAWTDAKPNSTFIRGFFAGCTPFQAVLHSTFDCLYHVECIELLVKYFPKLTEIDLNWNMFRLTGKQRNLSMNDYLNNLFVEEWSTEVNYSKYFAKCSPLTCTYTSINRSNAFYAITFLASLYGGLVIMFHLLAPFLVRIVFKFRYRPTNTNTSLVSYQIHLQNFLQSAKRLNLFKTNHQRTEEDIKRQQIISRTYLILLTVSSLVLLLFTTLSSETITITVQNPSRMIYQNLQVLYPDTLKCPCSTLAISYRTFISLNPILHQICSSDFVDSRWILILAEIAVTEEPTDWRNRASAQFRLLSNICQVSNNTVQDMVHRFMSKFFISSDVLSEKDFRIQIEENLQRFFLFKNSQFNLLMKTLNLLIQVDQPYRVTLHRHEKGVYPTILANITKNQTTDESSIQLTLPSIGTHDIDTKLMQCNCMTNPDCKSLSTIYNFGSMLGYQYVFDETYSVPGWFESCSATESLLLSTMECFYSNSDCYYLLMRFVEYTFERKDDYISTLYARPLIHNSKLSNFLPNTSIGTLVENKMIEKWNQTISYEQYFERCAPTFCTYLKKIRRRNVFAITATLISMIGGLTTSLRFLTPHLVNLIFHLLLLIFKKQQQQQQDSDVRSTCLSRLKTMIMKLFLLLYTQLIGLNLFPNHNFGRNVNQMTAQRLGRLTTRIYIVLLTIGFIVLALYTIIKPDSITKPFSNPPLDLYNKLILKYGDQLKCSCSSISLTHNQFIEIQPRFHQICSSFFVSANWRTNLLAGLDSNLLIYERKDYRRFLFAHMYYLSELCYHSNEIVNNTIEQFLSTLLVTTQLLSKTNFDQRLNLRIQQMKNTAPRTFTQLLFLIRNLNHGNSIVSTYGTNFRYTVQWNSAKKFEYMATESLTYDNQCSCALYSNCTSQAYFINRNSLERDLIKGLKIGCTPSESFRSSTLECFYDLACIHLIQKYTNSNKFIITSSVLTTDESRFPMKTTIEKLIDNLFVEDWKITMNYSLYYKACLPSICSYTYIKRANLLYFVTLLLGFQGGLTIILKIICPKCIRIIFKIYQYRKKSLPHLPVETIIAESTKTQMIPLIQCSNKIIGICLLILMTILFLISLSICIIRRDLNISISTLSSTTTVNVMNTTISTKTS